MPAILTRLLVLVFALSYGRGVLRNLVLRNLRRIARGFFIPPRMRNN